MLAPTAMTPGRRIDTSGNSVGMDSPAWINIAALSVALLTTTITSLLTLRALRLTRNANYLPVVLGLLAPHRNPSFIDKEDFVVEHIGDHDPAGGFRGLPQPIKSHALEVCQQYHMLGYLTRYNLADGQALAAQVGYNAQRIWASVEAHVRAERHLRGGEYTFFNSFESFVEAARELDSAAEMGVPVRLVPKVKPLRALIDQWKPGRT